MKWTVVWDRPALGQLANLWMYAPDRQAVTESADRIERELRVDADKKGAPFGVYRILVDDPLSVLFTVDPGDCMVKIWQVRRNK
jgi:hypothetical protein